MIMVMMMLTMIMVTIIFINYHINYHTQVILNLLLGVKMNYHGLPFMRMNEGTMMGPKQDKLFCSSCKVPFSLVFGFFLLKNNCHLQSIFVLKINYNGF